MTQAFGELSKFRSLRFTRMRATRRSMQKRGRRQVDFAAGDVGRGTTNADRGHDASALTRLRFHFASAPHHNTLLDRKAIGRPDKSCFDAIAAARAAEALPVALSSSMPSAGAHMRA